MKHDTAAADQAHESHMPETEALDYFRKLASFLYREIGAMIRDNHPEVFDRSSITASGFAAKRKVEAKRLYQETRAETDPERILQPYIACTGLTLDDVLRAFEDGDWLLGRKRYTFGGPNWARIARATIQLGDVIQSKDWRRVSPLVAEIRSLCHNHGRIVDKFGELDDSPDDPIDRTSALGLYRYATEYREAAKIIEAEKPGKLAIQIYYLYGHAIELALKAFLRSQGQTVEQLRSLGHDLDVALSAAEAANLAAFVTLLPDDRAVLELLNPYYRDKELEYIKVGAKHLPKLQPLRQCVDTIVGAVQAPVYMVTKRLKGSANGTR